LKDICTIQAGVVARSVQPKAEKNARDGGALLSGADSPRGGRVMSAGALPLQVAALRDGSLDVAAF